MSTGHRRGLRWSDDTGSLPFALLVVMTAMAVTALLVPLVLAQVTLTRNDMERSDALHAAQAGLDVALAHIRAASDEGGNGVLGRLPCGPLGGELGGGSPRTFETDVYYLAVDPGGHDRDWVVQRAMSCPVSSTPTHAWLRSTGTDGSRRSSRTLEATYTFRTPSADIPGGQPLHDIGEK